MTGLTFAYTTCVGLSRFVDLWSLQLGSASLQHCYAVHWGSRRCRARICSVTWTSPGRNFPWLGSDNHPGFLSRGLPHSRAGHDHYHVGCGEEPNLIHCTAGHWSDPFCRPSCWYVVPRHETLILLSSHAHSHSVRLKGMLIRQPFTRHQLQWLLSQPSADTGPGCCERELCARDLDLLCRATHRGRPRRDTIPLAQSHGLPERQPRPGRRRTQHVPHLARLG